MSARGKFSFTITDVGRFVGKSPVTLRGWEYQGLISFPRNRRGDRRVTLGGLREILRTPVVQQRCDPHHLKTSEAAILMLEIVEES